MEKIVCPLTGCIAVRFDASWRERANRRLLRSIRMVGAICEFVVEVLLFVLDVAHEIASARDRALVSRRRPPKRRRPSKPRTI